MENKKNHIVATILFAALLIFVFSSSNCFAEKPVNKTAWLEKKMSVSCGGRVLQEILEEISVNFGITITYDAKLAKTKMHCDITNSTVENILNRLFEDYSRGLIINPGAKTVIVQVFNDSTDMFTAGTRNDTPFLKKRMRIEELEMLEERMRIEELEMLEERMRIEEPRRDNRNPN